MQCSTSNTYEERIHRYSAAPVTEPVPKMDASSKALEFGFMGAHFARS
jgi:hypothetical protein